MIVALTGANGFIGGHLARQFGVSGWTVRPVTRADYVSDRLVERFADADVVVHAAGATRAPTEEALIASNVRLTEQTLDAARAAQVVRFVYLSSQAAAGPAASLAEPVTEESVPAPIEAYGRSKLEAEALVRSFTGMPFVIVRPAAVYGPGDRDFLAMHKLARRGVALHPGNREQWISIVHARDLAGGIVAASTDARAIGGTFFLANAEPVQWSTLFALAARCAERTLAVDVDVPGALVRFGATIGDAFARATGHASLLTGAKVALSTPPFWICSSDAARRRLAFSTPTELQRGLCETYHWYSANRWL